MWTAEGPSNIASHRSWSGAPLAALVARMLPMSVLASVAIGVGSAHAQSLGNCAALANLALPQTKIISATTVSAGPFSQVSVGDPYAAEGTTSPTPTCSSNVTSPQLPAFCRVNAAVSTPGAADPINIEVWLPTQNWNGRFVGVGNHGNGGEIEYADMGPLLVQGYAVGTTDTGHTGSSTAWMTNTQQNVNYGYFGVHEMTVKSKAIVTAAYGTPPQYSYWNGCSTGGKEGLMEAQRYPADYDGINIGGSANFAQIHNREQYVWTAQVTWGNAATPLGATQLALANAGALKACDALDGVVDGVIDNPLTCPFNVASLTCTQGQDPSTCLTAAQVTAVQKVYGGPHNPLTGQEIYPGYGYGTELAWTAFTAAGPLSSTAQTLFEYTVYNNPNWNFQTFKFTDDAIATDASFGFILDSADPDLQAFRNRGGKILQSHLWSSNTHPAARSIEYYDQVVSFINTNGGQSGLPNVLQSQDFSSTQQFYRLFMAPGGTGSNGPGTFDSLPQLQLWVEQGIPPSSIVASHFTNGVVDRTRPLCPYPAFAVYLGTGSTDVAANFKCSQPSQVPNYFVQDNMQREPLPATAMHDFNGDTFSDILWRNAAGNVGMWLMNGSTILQTRDLGNVAASWSIVGQRNFAGDRFANILWRDTAGNLGMWVMNGTQISSSTVLGNVPVNWSVSATGDFNGDGKADIVWRDTAGNVGIWLMNGTTILQSTLLGNVSNNWAIVGADLKGNIFWRNTTTGEVGLWVMMNAQIAQAVDFGAVPLSWTIVGIGDFDGNGSTDILWRDASGNVGIWLMNEAQIASTKVLGNVPSSWSVASTGDYNGDGKSDILWIDTSGNVGAWFMNGTTVSSTTQYGNVGTWTPQSFSEK